MAKGVIPNLWESAFTCPHCQVFANQTRFDMKLFPVDGEGCYVSFADYSITQCDHCKKPTIWFDSNIEYPISSIAAEAIDDMPNELKADFEEARKVLAHSPRASAALLRLVLQKLCNIVGDASKTIDQNIGQMVKDGLPRKMQELLDIVRVTGNEAVHPGEMNLKDDLNTAVMLFQIVNRIVERMIVEPKKFSELYASLPEAKLLGIENRDRHNVDNR